MELERWLDARPHLTACGLPRRPAGLARGTFKRDFVDASEPVVLQQLARAEGWRAPEAWADRGAFKQRHGGAAHEVRWPAGGRQVGILSRNSTVGAYLDDMRHPGAGMMFGATTVGRGTGHAREWATPKLFARRGWRLDEAILSLAPSKMGLPFHNHGSAWETVVVGRKLVVIIPPLDAPIPPAASARAAASASVLRVAPARRTAAAEQAPRLWVNEHGRAHVCVLTRRCLLPRRPTRPLPVPQALSLLEQAALFVGAPWDFIRTHYDTLAPKLRPVPTEEAPPHPAAHTRPRPHTHTHTHVHTHITGPHAHATTHHHHASVLSGMVASSSSARDREDRPKAAHKLNQPCNHEPNAL